LSAAPESRSLRDAAAVDPIGPGRYAAQISDDYTVVGHPNGGYLQCLLANAALAAASDEGSATSTPRPSRRTTSRPRRPVRNCTPKCDEWSERHVRHVELVQDEAVTSESLVTLGTLADDATVRYRLDELPALAPLEECLRRTVVEEIKLMSVVDFRLDPTCAMWLDGERSDLAEVKGWLRLNDGVGTWDAWTLLFASDGLRPPPFHLVPRGGCRPSVDVLRPPNRT